MVPTLVRESDLASRTTVYFRSFLCGLLWFMPTVVLGIMLVLVFEHRVMRPVAELLDPIFFLILALIYVGVPYSILREHHLHLRSRSMIIVSACCYSCGFLGCPAVMATSTVSAKPSTSLGATVMLLVMPVVVLTVMSSVTSGIGLFIWGRFRRKYPVVIVGSSPLCLACGYDLIGNKSLVCPECGRPFTFEELGTTAEEFRQRQVLAQAVARADNALVAPSRGEEGTAEKNEAV